VTETALRNYIIGSDQIENSSVTTTKINDLAVTGGKLAAGSVSFDKLDGVVNSTTGISKNSPSDTKIVTERAIVNYIKAQPLVLVMPVGPNGGGAGPSGYSHIADYIVNRVASASLYPIGQILKLVRRSINYSYTAPTLSYSTGGAIGFGSFVTGISFAAGSFSADFATSTDNVVWTYTNNGSQFVR
jgi:hypothetical protein